MALRNRQDGKVEIFVGTEKVDGISKNIIEFDELALKTYVDESLHSHSNISALENVAGTNTGDETVTTIKTKLGITTLSGSNTGDETKAGLITKLGIPTAADDTAAAALDPAVAVGGLYYTGTVFQVRRA